MKLHLPQLLSATLLVSLVATSVYAAEIPSGYETIDFWIPETLSDYASNTEDDYYAFKLYVDVACTPSTSPEWKASSPLVSGGNLIFTSADADNTASLSFSYGDSQAFNNVDSLEFDTLTHLEFTYIDIIAPPYNGSDEYVTDGGAIKLADNGSLVITGVNDGVESTSDVVFCGNWTPADPYDDYWYYTYYYCGGAISAENITMNGNGDISFIGNRAHYGGAISAENITMNGNGDINFIGNAADFDGAISSYFVTMNNNANVSLSNNSSSGDIIYSLVTLTMNENGNISVIGNSTCGGGVIRAMIVTMNNNGSIIFSKNDGSMGLYEVISGGSVIMNNNGSITFSGNSHIRVTGMSVSGPSIPYMDAHGNVTMNDNGRVIFSGNSVTDSYYAGGAIWGRLLFLRNNEYVLFEKNAEIVDGSYRLRSVCIDSSSSSISEISAASGKKIEFRDSVYIGSTLLVNADYTDETGSVHKQQGDIIFTGATTEDDLLEVKGSAGTEEEILASRTSKVVKTEIYGGRLRVEDGAIYQGQGIVVHEGCEASVHVKDAELNHVGYELEFNARTTLEVAGESTIRGNVNLQEGSVFKLELGAVLRLHETAGDDAATLSVGGTAHLSGTSTLNASLTLLDGATLDMVNLDVGAVTLNGFGGQVTIGENLLALLEDIKGQTEGMVLFSGIDSLTLPDVATTSASARLWAGSVFSNLPGTQGYFLDYKPDTGTLSIVYIPEPATVTLSLLALAALAARRRRR